MFPARLQCMRPFQRQTRPSGRPTQISNLEDSSHKKQTSLSRTAVNMYILGFLKACFWFVRTSRLKSRGHDRGSRDMCSLLCRIEDREGPGSVRGRETPPAQPPNAIACWYKYKNAPLLWGDGRREATFMSRLFFYIPHQTAFLLNLSRRPALGRRQKIKL